MNRLFGGLVLALALGGASLAGPAPVQIKDDKFSAAATFIGPSQFVNPFGGTSRSWFIRSFLNKSDHTVLHQLYVNTGYFWHWRFWQVAADDQAVSHPVEAIDQSVDDCSGGMCSYSETVAVDFDDAFLRAHATGFQIKLSAKSGDDLVLSVTSAQIQPVLSAIDAYVGATPQSPSAQSPRGVVLGIMFIDTPPSLATALGMPDLKGAFIAAVTPGSVAEKAGLKPGDCLVSYAGQSIAGRADLLAAVKGTQLGAQVSVTVVRGKDRLPLTFAF